MTRSEVEKILQRSPQEFTGRTHTVTAGYKLDSNWIAGVTYASPTALGNPPPDAKVVSEPNLQSLRKAPPPSSPAALPSASPSVTHDRAYWEQILSQIKPGMKRSDVERLLPPWLMQEGGWDHLDVFYPIGQQRTFAIQIIYYHASSRRTPNQADSSNDVVMETPTLRDIRPKQSKTPAKLNP
jgi:hypothetical protein